MSLFVIDPDEWETFSTSIPCGSCNGDLSKCNGMCTGSASHGQRRRTPVEVAKIKADRKAMDDALKAAKASEIADWIVREVAELGDRTSPADWPEAMLVTGPELHAIVLEAFNK